MAATSYYNPHALTAHEQNQHLLSSPGLSSGPSTPLKPHHPVSKDHTQYQHEAGFEDFSDVQEARRDDARLKANIRRLRLASRILALIISIAVLVPISMTLVKFLRTQHVERIVSTPTGARLSRTAWAKDTKAWPTYMYFSVAVVSVVLNFVTVLGYRYGVAKANHASYVASGFGWGVMVGNLVVWCVAAAMYRAEKDKGGHSNDLWGWTCSAPARAIQREFADQVDFNKYCDIQSISWYIGLVQVGAALLTVVIYILVFIRQRSKKNLKQQLRLSGLAGAEL